ncbi:hypothetical protein CEP51_013761 [Fusarium floridanum]|uniref:Apple domain-containing protein n=1 Tax=Fusarium floridanum TaxID=1325733 RepID=A0A428Q5F5_9HYPO|nr:hypothetical protein CEP51_013761 [Fusarium floridanum]
MAVFKSLVVTFVALTAFGVNAGPCIPKASLTSSSTLTATSTGSTFSSSETLLASPTETSTGTTTSLTETSSSTLEASSSETSLTSSESLVTSSTESFTETSAGTTTASTDVSSLTLVTLTITGTTETLTSATSTAELSTVESSSTEISTTTTSREPIRIEECAVLGGAGHDLSDDKLAEVKIEAYDDKTLDECLAICESQSDCATLAYNPTHNKCETWKGTLEQIGVDNTPEAEWYYYSTSCLANDRKDTCARPGWGLDGDLNTSGTKIGKFDGFDNYAGCYSFCKETEECAMFAFNPVEQLCELWSGSFEQAGFRPVFRASWTFYRLDCLEPRGGEGGAN